MVDKSGLGRFLSIGLCDPSGLGSDDSLVAACRLDSFGVVALCPFFLAVWSRAARFLPFMGRPDFRERWRMEMAPGAGAEVRHSSG